jgi:hypothetical protein
MRQEMSSKTGIVLFNESISRAGKQPNGVSGLPFDFYQYRMFIA